MSSTKYLVFIERNQPAWAVPLLLLPLLSILPPETRGESMAACSSLIALLALSAWRDPAGATGRLMIVMAAAIALPAAMAAGSPAAALPPLTSFFLAAAAGVAAACLPHRRLALHAAARIMALCGGLVSAHALYQKIWGLDRLAALISSNPAMPDRAILLGRIATGRAYAAFSTPAALGCFLALSLPATLGLALAAAGRRRALWLALSLLQVAGFLSAASATALGALLGAMALALLARRGGRRWVWIGLAAAGVILLGVVLLRGEELLSATHRNSPWRLRAGNFQAAWSMALEHPLKGVGPGGFAEAYPAFRRPGDNETRHAHNLPLEMAAELGWGSGLLASALFFFLFLRPLLRRRSEDAPPDSGIAIGLAAFALHNLADYSAFMPSLLWMAALLCGLSWRSASAPSPRPGAVIPRIMAGASLAVVVLAALLAARSGPARDCRLAARNAAYAGQMPAAERLADRALHWAPWDGEAALLLARLSLDDPPLPYAGEERKRLALGRAERAVAIAPFKPAARELRAMVRSVLGDYAGAYADFAEASRLYPINGEYAVSRDTLGRLIDEATGRPEGGR